MTAALFAAAFAVAVGGGLGPPPSASHVIGIWADGAASTAAADGIAREIERGWSGYRAVRVITDPARDDCRAKPYSAVLRVVVTVEGPQADTGLALQDCAGWNVEEWHALGDPRAQALGLLVRLRTWEREHPALAANVFDRGIAYDPATPAPTYFFVLFKPSDGYLRALVRAGGPAWTAGLRSGDVIDKIDGRFWWEYGTYQSQLRAYDGKPHTFDVQRGGVGGPAVHIALGDPFTG